MKSKCTLTDEQLIEKSFEWVKKLCDTGGRAWTLKIPADVDNDPDLIFCELGNRLRDLHQHLSQSREVGGYSLDDLEQAYNAGVSEGGSACGNFEWGIRRKDIPFKEWLEKDFEPSLPVPLTDDCPQCKVLKESIIELQKGFVLNAERAAQSIVNENSARVVEALKGGIKLVMDERKRQIEVEKFDYEHDEDYKNGELIGAAGCYVANALNKIRQDAVGSDKKSLAKFLIYDFGELDFLVNSGDRGDRRVRQAGWVDGWPWDAQWDKRKKHDKIRSLVIGAALIIAHLDKELEASPPPSEQTITK